MQTIFLLYSVAWVCEISNTYYICLLLVFDGIPRVFSFIYELFINKSAIFQKFIKLII